MSNTPNVTRQEIETIVYAVATDSLGIIPIDYAKPLWALGYFDEDVIGFFDTLTEKTGFRFEGYSYSSFYYTNWLYISHFLPFGVIEYLYRSAFRPESLCFMSLTIDGIVEWIHTGQLPETVKRNTYTDRYWKLKSTPQ